VEGADGRKGACPIVGFVNNLGVVELQWMKDLEVVSAGSTW
jgi:hypothetical protein